MVNCALNRGRLLFLPAPAFAHAPTTICTLSIPMYGTFAEITFTNLFPCPALGPADTLASGQARKGGWATGCRPLCWSPLRAGKRKILGPRAASIQEVLLFRSVSKNCLAALPVPTCSADSPASLTRLTRHVACSFNRA